MKFVFDPAAWSETTQSWGSFVPIEERISETHYVQPDLAEFRSPDGAVISGKRQWREHLKRTGTIEMGHSDIAAAQRNWSKKKEAFRERVNRKTEGPIRTAPVDADILSAPDYERTRVNCEVRNRLDGRPAPDRITLIKIAMEEARRR